MSDTYLTIESPSEGVIREKMSRFLAFAHPIDTVDQAKALIATYQNRYHDARHVCWAYMLGADRATYQSTDNGEPSGTAGKPILGQINSAQLTNVLIVVVRYFGGIKLGTPGLIAAYREAAREAIAAANIVERREMSTITFHFGYLAMNEVMKIAKSPGVKVIAQQFDNDCSMTLAAGCDDMPALKERLAGVESLTF